ncbi:MAG TPA: ester cyclase [Roseiflexaceae bacterium]|nr:ester cyclase [Roseiflexaceae bacterium]
MSVESTYKTMMAYARSHDTSFVAEDAVFTDISTGGETKGRPAIAQSLDYFFHQTFDAHPELTNLIAADGQATIEGYVVGKHTGEFAGIPATGKYVRVPIAVVYDLEDDQIKRARVYLMINVLLQQLGVQ